MELKQVLGLAIFISILHSAGSRDATHLGTLMPSGETIPETNDSKRIFLDAVGLILKMLDSTSGRHLDVLYDQENKEIIRSLSPLISGNLSGITVSQYGEEESELHQSSHCVPWGVPVSTRSSDCSPRKAMESILSLLKTVSRKKSLLVLLCKTDTVLEIFQTIQNVRLESHHAKWIFISLESPKSGAVQKLENLVYEGTDVVIVYIDDTGAFDFYHSEINLDGFIRFTSKGKWTGGSDVTEIPFLLGLEKEEESKLPDMRGRRMTVATIELWPFVRIDEIYPNGTVHAPYGTDISILNLLAAQLNFTYALVRPHDGTWGFPMQNGSINGMMGMVYRREVNFAICAVSVNEALEKVIDYTVSYSQGYLKIFSSAPKLRNRALAVLSPFTLQVWLYIIATVLAIGTVLTLQQKLLQSFLKVGDYRHTHRSDLWHPVHRYYFFVFRSLLIQGNPMKTYSWSQRFLLYSWYLFGLIVAALYSGMLTAVLAVPAFETPVDSLHQLAFAVRDKGFTLGVTKESSNEYLFKDATEGIYKEVWDLFNHEDRSRSFVDTPIIGMKRILESRFIFIWFGTMGKNVADGLGGSKFHISRESFSPMSFAFAISPGAPYREAFSEIIMKIVEGGLMAKWEDDANRKNPKPRSEDGDNRSYAITISHLQAAFLILVLGFITSGVALALEFLLAPAGIKSKKL